MEELKEIKLNDTVYVKKEAIESSKETGLYRTVKYCGFNWKVLGEDAEGILLQTEDILSSETIKKIFSSNDYDYAYDVKFSNNNDGWRWSESIIREILNSKFLEMLNKDDLVEMTTEAWLDGEADRSKDYVRLLTIDEIQRIPKVEKEKSRWNWSLSPSYMHTNGSASVFDVDTNGSLNDTDVDDTAGGVAPVIKLKTGLLKESNK